MSSDDVFTIDFAAGGNSHAHTVFGWSSPEANETWSNAPVSRVLLPVHAHAAASATGRGSAGGRRGSAKGRAEVPPAAYVLVLQLRPYVMEGRLPVQRLHVSVGGTEVAHFTLRRRTTRTCVIPWHLVEGRKTIDVDFAMPDATRPATIEDGNDRRQLGIALARLSLRPDRFGPIDPDRALADQDGQAIDINAVTAADHMPLHELLLKFESLGQNCEFGLVQRKCQAEPLGLLRFSSTPLPQLLRALEAGFEGMGEPSDTAVTISPNGREYMVSDRRYGFLYHAWVSTGEMTMDDVHRREIRRVPFLVRKLLEDLEEGEKIFVFKGMGALSDEEAFPLAMALRRHGPNTLLLVTLSDAEHRGGTVEARAAGFMIGYLDRFAPGEDAQDFLLGQWVRLCREACRLRMVNTRAVA